MGTHGRVFRVLRWADGFTVWQKVAGQQPRRHSGQHAPRSGRFLHPVPNAEEEQLQFVQRAGGDCEHHQGRGEAQQATCPNPIFSRRRNQQQYASTIQPWRSLREFFLALKINYRNKANIKKVCYIFPSPFHAWARISFSLVSTSNIQLSPI